MFWPDYWMVANAKLVSIEAVFGNDARKRFGTMTYESGQIVLDKVSICLQARQHMRVYSYMYYIQCMYVRHVISQISQC